MRPFIVDFEGLDGSGKTIHAMRVAMHLANEGRNVTVLKFPDHTSKTGKYIRAHLAEKWRCEQAGRMCDHQEELDAAVFQCLQVANRLEQLPDEALADHPAHEDHVLVTDRLYVSGIVYGLHDGLDKDWLKKVGRAIPKPNVTFFLDVSPEVAMERIRKRMVLERYEKQGVSDEGVKVLSRLRKLFYEVLKELSTEHSTQVYMINAAAPEDEVFEQILSVLPS